MAYPGIFEWWAIIQPNYFEKCGQLWAFVTTTKNSVGNKP